MATYEEQAEEFLRLNSHRPTEKLFCDNLRNMIYIYKDCNVRRGGLFTDQDLEDMLYIYLRDYGVVKILKTVQKALNITMGIEEKKHYMLVTVNFPDTFKDYAYMRELVQTVKNFNWVVDLKYQYENYTDKGEHPHIHLLITSCEHKKPSEYAKLVHKAKGLGKILKYESVDYRKDKAPYDVWVKYVNGEKREEKMENCEKDELWRIENNFQNT